MSIQNIVLVHGFWADASCYGAVLAGLLAEGYNVIAVQNPLSSLADDVAATQRALNRLEGRSILVGHSWGGTVITAAGNSDRVAALVYLAALAPDIDESMVDLMSRHGAPSPHFQPQDDVVWITQTGVQEILASDLSAEQVALIHATQNPPSTALPETKLTEVPAWKQKPSWYVIATEDRAVPLALQQELADRMGASVRSVAASHFLLVSQAQTVIDVIKAAAEVA